MPDYGNGIGRAFNRDRRLNTKAEMVMALDQVNSFRIKRSLTTDKAGIGCELVDIQDVGIIFANILF